MKKFFKKMSDQGIKQQNLVSVIIPSYNSASYIREAVDSVLAQTYANREVIVVDDGSTDNTAKVLAPYIREQKIIYIHQENKGLPAARNVGIRASRGEFVALLDSDDIFLPNKLERQISYLLHHPDCGVCYCDIYQFYEEEPEKLLKLNYQYYSGDDVFPNLLRMNFIGPLTVVLRKSEIDRAGLFDERIRWVEDWEYWVRLAQHNVRFDHLPEMLAKYRMRKTSITHNLKAEIQRKAATLQFIKTAVAAMPPKERQGYHVPAILLTHRAKLWYAYAETYFPPLRWLITWRQKSRLTSV